MQELKPKRSEYLLSWISWVSRPVGMRVDLSSFQIIKEVKISLAIPFVEIDQAKELLRCIEDLEWNEKKELQVVVLSTSRDAQILKEIIRSQLREFVVTILVEENVDSRWIARSRCIESSVGDFVAFLDGNCLMNERRLKDQYEEAKIHGCDEYCLVGCLFEDGKGKKEEEKKKEEKKEEEKKEMVNFLFFNV